MYRAASGHADEAAIADLVKNVGKEFGPEPKVTRDERRRRMALIDLLSTGRCNTDQLPPEDRARFIANFKAAVEEEERQSAESTPKTKSRNFDDKVSIDDYVFEEKRRRNNA
jgi:hypothetical protein